MQSSAITDWPHPTAVIAHDAGAANLIIAWIKAWGWPVRTCVDGPARKLWEQAFPGQPTCSTIEDALQGCTSLLTGTGWASRLEHDARRLGRDRGMRVAAVVDHWVNYPPRFEREGETVWPDELWVADAWAAAIATQTLPPMPIRQLENLYLKYQVEKVSPPPGDGTLLYVLEPVRSDWGRSEQGEFQALDYTLQHLQALGNTLIHRIVLRPHPSDPADKYRKYLTSDNRIEMDRSTDMAEAISRADMVVGVESFALTLALAAGRVVYSSLPPCAPALRLPQESIQEIRRLCPALPGHAHGLDVEVLDLGHLAAEQWLRQQQQGLGALARTPVG
jgi:hypothetical protein